MENDPPEPINPLVHKFDELVELGYLTPDHATYAAEILLRADGVMQYLLDTARDQGTDPGEDPVVVETAQVSLDSIKKEFEGVISPPPQSRSEILLDGIAHAIFKANNYALDHFRVRSRETIDAELKALESENGTGDAA